MAILRIVAAGTSQIASAHSGVYAFMWLTSLAKPVSPSSRPSPSTSPSGPSLDGVGLEAALERLHDIGCVVRDRPAARGIPDQRLLRILVAQVVTMGADEIG